MRPQMNMVLQRLICQTECKCYKNINFRGLTFPEYKAIRDYKHKQLCFYDENDNFRIKVESKREMGELTMDNRLSK